MATRPASRRHRLLRSFERAVLGLGMSIVAFVVERRLIKAIRKGGIAPAPRTAAERDEAFEVGPGEDLAAAAQQVHDQTRG